MFQTTHQSFPVRPRTDQVFRDKVFSWGLGRNCNRTSALPLLIMIEMQRTKWL
jgi:hypothetical protein